MDKETMEKPERATSAAPAQRSKCPVLPTPFCLWGEEGAAKPAPRGAEQHVRTE